MSRIKSKDTKIEIVLRKALWAAGIRYRKNVQKLPGKPDVLLSKWKVVIFCDSEFWHGKNFGNDSFKSTINKEYWINKISNNVEHDLKINLELNKMGYRVLRFWGKDILNQTNRCVDDVRNQIKEIEGN